MDFWDDYSSNQIAKDAAEMQQQLANQQEALRKDEENRRLAKLQDIEERRAVLEPGMCTHKPNAINYNLTQAQTFLFLY